MELNQDLSSFFSSNSGSGASPANPPSKTGDLSGFLDAPKPQRTQPIDAAAVTAVADQEGLTPRQKTVMAALLGQESGNGTNAVTSVDGARGAGQIMPGTFKQYAKAGESIDNEQHNLAVMARIVKDLGSKYGDDPAKIATGYFSGEGNVNRDGSQAWRDDRADGNGKRVSSYVADVVRRVAGIGTAEAKTTGPDLSKAPKWADVEGKAEFKALSPEQQAQAKSAYFDYWIAPRAGQQADSLRQQFLTPAQKAEPGIMDKVGDAMNTVRDVMGSIGGELVGNKGSVMDRANVPPAEELPTTSKAPVRPEVRQAFNAQWDAATPEQRTAMSERPDWVGMLARERAGVFERVDANGIKAAEAFDTRAEGRRARLVGQGEDPRFAERAAREGAAKGALPGQEIAALGGTVQPSTFDFDTKQLFDTNQPTNGLNNPLVRGVVKGASGIGKAVLGVDQFIADALGADEYAKAMKKGGDYLRGKEDALGESGNFMERNFEGAISSIAQQLPLLITGTKIESEAVPLAGMAMQSFGQEYSDGRAAGQSIGEATTRASIFAAFEVIGEKFGLKENMQAIKAAARGMPSDQIVGFLWSALKKEVPGEVLTTTGQFGTDKLPNGIGLNPNATGADYLKQVADTVAQTIMQTGAMAGGTTGVSKAVQYARDRGPLEGVANADAELAKQQALNKWNTNGLNSRIEPTVSAVPDVASVTPDGRIEPTLNQESAVTVTPAESAGAPAVHPTVQAADDIVRELATDAGIPHETVLPTQADPIPDGSGVAGQEATSDQDVIDFASNRYQQLREKRDGQTQSVMGETGMVDQDVPGVGLSPAEQQELNGLQRAGNDPKALRAIYGFGDSILSDQSQLQNQAQVPAPSTAPVEQPTEGQQFPATTKPGLVAAQEDQNVETQQQNQATGPALDQGASVPNGQPSGPTAVQEPATQAPAAQNDVVNAVGNTGQQDGTVQANDAVIPLSERSDDDLRQQLRDAGSRDITRAISAELQRRKDAAAKPTTEKQARQQKEAANGTQAPQAQQAEAQGQEVPAAEPVSSTAPIVRDANAREISAAKDASPMLDLHKKQTGWKQVPLANGNGTILVSADGKKAVAFESANKASGTEGLRANALAQAYAIDNPYSVEATQPQGELVVEPMFKKKPATEKEAKAKKAESVAEKQQSDVSKTATQNDTSEKRVDVSDKPQRYEYPTPLKGQPAYLEPAQRAVVDFMNGDIDKPALLQRFTDFDLTEGQIRSVTNRIDITKDEIDQVAAMRAANKPKTEKEAKAARTKKSAPKVEKKATPAAESSTNTEDAGAELTYNKRNRTTAGIQWTDIADKDAALRVKETTKQNVYPRPDYAALVEGGMQPLVAHLVKQAYDSLASAPQVSKAPTDDQLKAYIQGVQRYMNGVMAWANDNELVKQWVAKTAVRAGAYLGASKGVPTSLSEMAQQSTKSLLDVVYPNGWKEHRDELILIGGNKALGALQPSTTEALKANKDIAKGWPAKQEAWQKQGYKIVVGSKIEPDFYESTRNGTPRVYAMLKFNDGRRNITIVERTFEGIASKDDAQVQEWVKMEQEAYKPRFVVLDKNNRVKAWGMSQEAAEQQARDLTKRTGGGGIKDEGISVEMASRTGVEHRMPGEDISSERLVETFGFKGVNFGNWMKGDSNKAERQLHLNHVFDAFMDLAAIFGVPPKAMSLNGLLGIAVGAQGNGKYAAHFVPGVNEINLTRTSGAGSLAHEWGHALDHYFARQAELTREADPFLTEHAPLGASMKRMEMVNGKYQTVEKSRFGEGVRPEIVEAFKSIVQAMSKRPITEEEVALRREEGLARTVKNTDSWLKAVRRDFESAKASDEVLAKVDALAERVRKLDLGDGKVSVSTTFAISQPVAEMRDLYKKTTGRTYSLDQTKGLQSNIDHLKYLTDDKQDAKTHTPQQVSTTYAKEAAALDGDKGGKRYWSTNLEMFARAFDAYVSDKLEAQAANNTYLSHAGRTGETVPRGAERTAINEAIQKLVDTVESKETAQGVALFNTSRTGTSLPMQLSLDAVKKSIESALKRVPNAPNVEVVASPATAGIAVPAGVIPKGVTLDDGSILIFADAAESVTDVFETVFHELFHRGSKVRFTENVDYIKTMLDIAASDETVRDLVAEWKKSPDGQDKLAEFSEKGPMTGDRLANYEAIAVEEALAQIGEKFATQEADTSMLKRITDFLAKVAKAWGMDRLAQWLKNEKQTNTEKFVLETIRMSGGQTNKFSTSLLFSAKNEPTVSDTTRKTQNNLIQFFGNRDGKSLKTFGLYDKTLSTQYNKALKDKHFGKVFGYVNAMQNEVSLTSIRPAELAPGVLPRVDDVKSAAKQLVKGKKSDNHLNIASKAIFDGTLDGDTVMQGKVWSESEFMARPGATEAAWGLYQQGRAAIDASLTEVAAAEAYAMAQGFVPKTLRRQIIDTPQAAERLIADQITKQIKMLDTAIEKAKSIGADEQQSDLERARESYLSTQTNIDKIFATAKNLKQAGYAPLMRFGKFTVTVQPINPENGHVLRDENGESITEFFGQYETEGEAKSVRTQMEAKYAGRDDMRVKAGTKSQSSHELYSGISPETLALFAEAIGADAAMRKHIELAMTERSALKRRLHRKGTEGYSEDLPRVLSQFITSNGRHAAQRYYLRDLNNAIKYIPKEKGDVLDEAIRLKKFVLNPNDPAAPLSSVMFAWFLGGSVASAIVNLTQPVMMTAPYLSQFGVSTATKALAKAMPYALGKKQITDMALRDALKRASQEGIVDAQEIFHLYSVGAQGVASGLVNQLAKLPGVGNKIKAGSEDARARINAFMTLWGSMFAVAEGFNRKLTFVAAWEVAKANGEKNPFAFAVRAVNETQGIYNKVNRPNWAQGKVGRVLMTFKQYSIMYVELLTRMWKRGGPEGKRAALTMLAVLMLAAGEDGLPFSQDLDDLIDTIGQGIFKSDTNMKRNKRRLAHEILGKSLGDMFLYGVSPYLPLDFAGRIGLGNLIPGTALLKPSDADIRGRQMAELFGPTAGMATQIGDAYDAVVEGNNGKAVQNLAPKAVKDALAAGEMAKKGYATDAKGRKVVDVGLGDAAIKGIGFQPTKVAEETRKTMPVFQDIALQKKTEASIVGLWSRGITDNDQDMIREAVQRRDDWNKRNPDTPIHITQEQVRSRVRQALIEKDARLLKQAPREMRGRVGLDLAK